MPSFASKHRDFLVLAAIFLFVLAVSLPTLTTRPRLWADEAKSIELALNFWRFGILDIQTAPGEFSGIPHLLQSTGYPVTIPLAGVFALFGFSMTVARTYMLFWMVVALCGIFFFLKRLFGAKEALFAVALIATFASFHDNSRTVVGETPGFVFMLIGLGLWSRKSDFRQFLSEVGLPIVAGFFFGLAVVTKPSIYMAILPAIAVALYFQNKNIKQQVIDVFFVAIGSIIPAILWLFVVVGNPFNALFWKEILFFWQNPFHAESTSGNIVTNLRGVFLSTTLMYFGALFVLLLCAAKSFWRDEQKRVFFVFVTLYSAFAFLYYLRSPGWLRYIITAELLILMVTPRALYELGAAITQRFKMPRLAHIPTAALFLLIIIQVVHFFTAAQIYTSDVALRTGEYLNQNFPQKSIGVVDAITLGIFIDPVKKYQVVSMIGLPQMGENPVLRALPPEIIIGNVENVFMKAGSSIVKREYKALDIVNEYTIYGRLK